MFIPLQILRSRGHLCLGVATLAALGGCNHYEAPGLPAAPPVGINVNAIEQTQIEGALADKLTIYRQEWQSNGDTLGDYGSQHMDEIVSRATETDHPILIEKSTDAKLDEARREFLVHYLAQHEIADADQRVLIGRPVAAGEAAEDSIEVYQNKPQASGGGGGGGGGGK